MMIIQYCLYQLSNSLQTSSSPAYQQSKDIISDGSVKLLHTYKKHFFLCLSQYNYSNMNCGFFHFEYAKNLVFLFTV